MAYGLLYGMASRDIVLCFFLTVLLYSSFGQTMPKSEVQPEFLALLENHTVTQGRDTSFTCIVNHLQSYKVAWIKSDSRAILAIHTRMIAHNPRLSVTHNGHNTWKLHVTNVQPNDSGTYMCQVNTDPMRSQTGYMKVVIPPDIMDVDDSTDLLTAEETSDLRLRCHATGTPKPMVTWRRQDGRNITLRTENGISRVKSYEGDQLNLTGILRQEMGSYLCIASNGIPPTVSKRYYVNVRFKPLIEVSNQLVAAPVNSDVVLHCYIESSPKALNTWYKDGGVKLLPDEKYELTETAINDYAYQLNLTVKRLKRLDFGSYTCTSENALGKVEGTIRLQELHLLRTSPIPMRNTDYFEKHGWHNRAEKKGKKLQHTVGHESSKAQSKNSKNLGHTTPTSWCCTPNTMPDVRIRHSKTAPSPNETPASAPAQFAPTQLLDVENGVKSYRYTCSDCIPLMLILLILIVPY